MDWVEQNLMSFFECKYWIDKNNLCYYNNSMKIEFDEAKNHDNIKVRGLNFDLAYDFDFDNALEVVQVVGGETRYFALGYIHNRLHALVYTLRGENVRIISLRKANKREVKKYEQFS